MAKEFVSKVKQSELDIATAQLIIANWQEGDGSVVQERVRFGLEVLSMGNRELADEVYEYLKSECGY
jgi:hypothetical protein